ncbi:efflux RND transporter periplasmic adaptor subunit [Maricaulis parjimensis]|uniref:efflux RND transporter periplasmic adaptor subunit n=1 Tax=Maricaulis parjimensis TaxID=144023 RepID=UPI00193A2CC2|nr:efflux RND transporter periplasmic adaptor subunit [Maricaulis parjimensis]
MATGLILSLALAAASLQTADTHTVEQTEIPDRKAVFATVESIDTITARARIGGTIGQLQVDEGDSVEAGDVLAVVVDDRLAPQIAAANAQANAFAAQFSQAEIDLERAEDLHERGIYPQARLDQARTQVDVVSGQLAAARRSRDVLVQQSREGDVLAPASGRVLAVPVTSGSVILPGEAVATIASDLYLLRLRLPERHARTISEGDPVEIGTAALGGEVAPTGRIRQVYPRIEDGRVVADAVVDGLGDFFVGERVRVYVTVDARDAILIPADYISTRYGVDYVRLQLSNGHDTEIVVQRGLETSQGVEILSGLSAGDVLVRP